MSIDLTLALEVARQAAAQGGAAALQYFQRDVQVERKPDRSPVTAADRAAEEAIVQTLWQTFPDHSVLAEERGFVDRGSPYRWIVDPLDGTKGFVRGLPFWGPLVALEHEGHPVVGVAALPALKQVYWAASGRGCFLSCPGEPDIRVHVSSTSDWQDATVSLGEVRHLLALPEEKTIRQLAIEAASTRSYGDVGGAVFVLSGQCDVWLEAGVKHWDLAAIQILITEAGGRFSDFAGAVTPRSGNAIAANPTLHRQVLSRLAGG